MTQRWQNPCGSYQHPHPNPPGMKCRCPGFCKICGWTELEHEKDENLTVAKTLRVTPEERALALANFESEVKRLVNRNSIENLCNTPDYIIAGFLRQSLESFVNWVNERENWYGK